MSNQKPSPRAIILKSIFNGALAMLALFIFYLVLMAMNAPFWGSVVFLYAFIGFGFGTPFALIGGLTGFLISWLVIRFASQSLSHARVIGALVTITIIAVLEVLPMIDSFLFDPYKGIFLLIYIAIGIWGAGRIYKSAPSESNSNNVKIHTRSYYISVVLLGAMVVIGGSYIVYNSIPFTAYETHSMKFDLNSDSQGLAPCEVSYISLEFVESPSAFYLQTCSPELYEYLKNETATVITVDFKATHKATNWTYEIQRIGSWTGTVDVVTSYSGGLYEMRGDYYPFLHEPFGGMANQP